MPQENLLCTAYCVLATLRPQYRDAFERMRERAALFDCQGRNKYWNMPPPRDVLYPLCGRLWPFVSLWLALLYAADEAATRDVLARFDRDAFDPDLMAVAVTSMRAALASGAVPADFLAAVVRVTGHMFDASTVFPEWLGSADAREARAEL